MEETTGAPSSFAALSPRRLRASSRDGGGVVNRPPSPLIMLLSRHTRRREFPAADWRNVSRAELSDRLEEALQQQAAVNEILAVISRSPGDLQPVFGAIVENATRPCDAAFSAVARLDDGLLHLVATSN